MLLLYILLFYSKFVNLFLQMHIVAGFFLVFLIGVFRLEISISLNVFCLIIKLPVLIKVFQGNIGVTCKSLVANLNLMIKLTFNWVHNIDIPICVVVEIRPLFWIKLVFLSQSVTLSFFLVLVCFCFQVC